MLGYWNNHAATAQVIDHDGWLHTGDQARIDDTGHIYITGRIKDILILSNGEKIPARRHGIGTRPGPAVRAGHGDRGGAALSHSAAGAGQGHWEEFAKDLGLDPLAATSLREGKVLQAIGRRVKAALKDFPGYAKIRRVHLSLEPWSVEDGLITPTMKVKRPKVLGHYAGEVDAMYRGGPAD